MHMHAPRGSIDLRVVTYNIHRAIGMDRRKRPERIAKVLADVNADVIALQEVIGPGRSGPGHAQQLGAELGMGWVMASTRELRGHQFGNVVLSRYPIHDHAHIDLSWKTCEPRGDFNEWVRGLVADVLADRMQSLDLFPYLKRRRTYPGFFPVLHLDHLYFEGHIEVRRIELPRTRLALLASDHLPLVVDIRIGY
jgi:endonuclease/exonuclease/phosphatase family metal-dependent hydrolase